LRQYGWIACSVEKWIAQHSIRVDAFHFADILAAHPRQRRIMLVQATSAANIGTRVSKIRSKPEAAAWLKAGGEIQVWGWAKRGDRWRAKVTQLLPQDLAAVVVQAPARRGKKPRQRQLFD
jgi:hypothetical protein